MSHEEIKLLLQDYLENLLDESERKNIESHLSICSECRKELADLKELIYSIESLPELEPPNDIKDFVMARVRSGVVAVPLKVKIRKWVPILGYAYLLGALLLMGTFYGIYWAYQRYVQIDPIDLFTRGIVAMSTGLGKLVQWLEGVWIAGGALLHSNLPAITTMLTIETVILIAGIAYWIIRKQKSTYFIFA